MINKKNLKKNIIIALGALFIFMLFFYICSVSPLAGDDWGYAINGLKGNPFVTAIEFYNNWSGRFFSELSGFILAPNKWLWNFVNPLLFMGIYLLIIKMVNPNKNLLLISLVTIFLMLSVKDNVRMETYTWIMGTANYVIPLFLLVLILYCYKEYYIDDNRSLKYLIIIAISSFIATLMMENVAGGILLLNGGILIYSLFNKYIERKYSLIIFVTTLIAFIILRSSPGAAYRISNSHGDWVSLSLMEQIYINWPNFLKYTIMDNKYLMMILSLVLMSYTYLNIFRKDRKLYTFILLNIIYVLLFIQSISASLAVNFGVSFLDIFYNVDNPYCSLFITLLMFALIISIIYVLLKSKNVPLNIGIIIIFVLAGAMNVAMLLSPIFGSRSSLFTIYLIILMIAFLLNEIRMNKIIQYLVILIIVICNIKFVISYVNKYRLVASINQERMSQIQYYVENPDVKEAWIVRMPIMSLHSADVEKDNAVHMDTFKQYYGLQSDVDVNFYFKDKY